MAKGNQGIALRHLDTLFSVGTLGGLTDAQLLERFTSRRDQVAELAFAALIERHGPMVLRTCHAVLRDTHDAHDAFQATFLVLLRRARSLWVRDSLGPWLHRVAHLTASSTRAASARRRRHEGRAAASKARSAHECDHGDLAGVIHEEVERLPQRYRAAVVLCLLEGLTPDQAARHLSCPVGTVHSRLARGRERLRSHLARRGLAPTSAGFVAAFSGEVQAVVPEALVRSTLRAATLSATGMSVAVPSTVAVLWNGVSLVKLKAAATSLLLLGGIAAGAAVLAQQGARDDPARESEQEHGVGVGSDRIVGVPTEFLSIPERARSFAYVIDHSGSMATRNSLDVAKRELRASIEKLTPDVRFFVVFYELRLTVFSDVQGHPGMMAATEANKARVRTQLDDIIPEGGTDQVLALRSAMAEDPEAIYFLTDADVMSIQEARRIITDAGKARINVILFGRGASRGDSPLRILATKTGGIYRYCDVTKFPPSPDVDKHGP